MFKYYKHVKQIPANVRVFFEEKYGKWEGTWNDPELQVQSNPRMFAKSGEYDDFITFCKQMGKQALLLVFDRYEDGDDLAINAIEDLTLDGYGDLMGQIVDEGNKLARAERLTPSQSANWTNYVKELLAKIDFSDLKGALPDGSKSEYGQNGSVPDEIQLRQNYPNPFNMTTVIRFALPTDNLVSLKIYNMLGQEIAVIADNQLFGSGWHNLWWNGTDKSGKIVSTGIYLYRLVAGSRVLTQKLAIIK